MTEPASSRAQLKSLKVCILTPGQIGSNPRVVKEADALVQAGADVTVIAVRMLARIETRDQSLIQRISWRLIRLDLSARLTWRLRRARQLAYRLAFMTTGISEFADLAFSAYTSPLLAAAMKTSADLYIAHYPAALPAAAAAARRHGGRYAYDAEDFHLGDWPDRAEFEGERRMLRAIEKRYLPGCSHVTAAAPGIADAYEQAYGVKRPAVVLNVFPLAQAPHRPTEIGTVQPGPSVYWFSQTIGPGRGLECAVEAAARADTRPHLYLRGTPAPGYVEILQHLANEFGAGDRLHILAPEEPDKMERLAAEFDIGLCGEPGLTGNNAIALSNKLFSYLLAGIPVIMSSTPGQSSFARDAEGATRVYPSDDPAEMASAIDHFLSDRSVLAKARRTAHALARQTYNWDLEQAKFLRLVELAAVQTGAQKV